MNMMLSMPTATPIDQLQSEFLAMLPQIVAVAKFGFRSVACPEKKADAIAECIALAWKWFVRLNQRGQKERAFPTALGGYAVKQVRSGRGVAGQVKCKDVMNAVAQRRFGFKVEPLPNARRHYAEAVRQPTGQRHLDAFEEQLRYNTQTPVDDQVAFRVDFPDWLGTRTLRDRQIIGDLAMGERTLDVARKHHLSPARISQLRGAYRHDWEKFGHSDAVPDCP